jgi:outer membrane receptor protein involved in Fe transport
VLLYNPIAPLVLSGDVTRNFRAPTFNELFPRSGPDNKLELEKSWSTNAGAAWKKGPFGIKANAFATTIKDLIHSDAANTRLINEGEEKNRGLETELEFFTKNNIIKASHSRQKSRRAINGQPFAPSALTPEKTFLASWKTYLRHNISMTNEWRYKSEQYELDNHQGVRIPPYSIWSIRFGMKILETNFYFDVQNITRRRYADALGSYTPSGGSPQTVLSPQPDRTYWAGFSRKFKN